MDSSVEDGFVEGTERAEIFLTERTEFTEVFLGVEHLSEIAGEEMDPAVKIGFWGRPKARKFFYMERTKYTDFFCLNQ